MTVGLLRALYLTMQAGILDSKSKFGIAGRPEIEKEDPESLKDVVQKTPKQCSLPAADYIVLAVSGQPAIVPWCPLEQLESALGRCRKWLSKTVSTDYAL